MFRKVIYARPRKTNNTGSDYTVPKEYKPDEDLTMLTSVYSVPSGKTLVIRNITLAEYYASQIVTPSADDLYGSPYVKIGDIYFIHTPSEIKLFSASTGGTYNNVWMRGILANLQTFLVAYGGDDVEIGLIVRSVLAKANLPNGQHHEATVMVTGVEI